MPKEDTISLTLSPGTETIECDIEGYCSLLLCAQENNTNSFKEKLQQRFTAEHEATATAMLSSSNWIFLAVRSYWEAVKISKNHNSTSKKVFQTFNRVQEEEKLLSRTDTTRHKELFVKGNVYMGYCKPPADTSDAPPTYAQTVKDDIPSVVTKATRAIVSLFNGSKDKSHE